MKRISANRKKDAGLPLLAYGSQRRGGKLPKLEDGAELEAADPYMKAGVAAGGVAGTLMTPFITNQTTGKQKVGLNAASGALKGAAVGTAAGSFVPGVGTLVGGAVGLLGGGIAGALGARRNNRDIDSANEEAVNAQRILANQIEDNRQKSVLSTYATQGLGTNYYNSNGGMISLSKGGWIQDAVNPEHKGYCTPMSKPTCTGHRRALAVRFKHGDLSHKANGGLLDDPTDDNTQEAANTFSAYEDGGNIQKPTRVAPLYFDKGMAHGESRHTNATSPDGKYKGVYQVDTLNLPSLGVAKEDWNDSLKVAKAGEKMIDNLYDKTNGNERETVRRFMGNPTEAQINARMKFINDAKDKSYQWHDEPNKDMKLQTPGYAVGGKLPNGIRVHNADKLSSKAVLVDGKTHEQGGEIVNKGSNPVAEVEDGEVLRQAPDGGTQVYSDKLGYADEAKQIEAQRGVVESQYQGVVKVINDLTAASNKTGDMFTRNTNKRKLDILKGKAGQLQVALNQLNQRAEQLFQEQEAAKQQAGENVNVAQQGDMVNAQDNQQPVGRYGMKIPKYENGGYDVPETYPKYKDPLTLDFLPEGKDNLANPIVDANGEPTTINKISTRPVKSVDVSADQSEPSLSSSTGNKSSYHFNSTKFRNAMVPVGLFADNIANDAITNRMPSPTRKSTQPYANVILNTNYNAQPQLQRINDLRKIYSRNINFTSPNATSASIRKAIMEGTLSGQESSILANKENTETGLKNQMTMTNAGVNQANTNMANDANTDYANSKRNWIETKLRMKSQNLSNAAGDVSHLIERGDMKDYQTMYAKAIAESSKYGTSKYRNELLNEDAISSFKDDNDAQAWFDEWKKANPEARADHERVRQQFAKNKYKVK